MTADSNASAVEVAAPASSSLVIQADEWTEERKALLKRTYAAGATDDEIALFFATCKRLRLSPEARQIFSVARWDNTQRCHVRQTQVSIDGLRLIAERTGQYRGQTPVEWCGTDGVWKEIWTSDEPPFAARVGVYREGFVAPLYRTAKWKAFVQTDRNSKPTYMWLTKGDHMLGKCAEANALRAAFPNECSGVYTTDEMGQASNEAPGSIECASSSSPAEPRVPIVNFSGHPHNGQPMSELADYSCLALVLKLQAVAAADPQGLKYPELPEYIRACMAYARTRGISSFTRDELKRLQERELASSERELPQTTEPPQPSQAQAQEPQDDSPVVRLARHPLHGKHLSELTEIELIRYVRGLRHITGADQGKAKYPSVHEDEQLAVAYAATRGITDFSDAYKKRAEELATAIVGDSPECNEELYMCVHQGQEALAGTSDIRKWSDPELLITYATWLRNEWGQPTATARAELVEARLKELIDAEKARAEEALARKATSDKRARARRTQQDSAAEADARAWAAEQGRG